MDLRARFNRATAHLDPPIAIVDLAALRANAADLVRRAAGKPIRVASTSVRSRALIDDALSYEGYAGIMAYSLAEAIWLVWHGATDILVGYPSTDRHALRQLASDPARTANITLMVDDVHQLELIDATLGERHPVIRVCIDVDASFEALGKHMGVRRSPLREPEQVAKLARKVARRKGFRLVGLMFYEAQVADVPDSSLGARLLKFRSANDLHDRRREVARAVRRVAPLEFVNGGGTGSLEVTAADRVITEVTAGSGLFGPTLFDGYRRFSPKPAAWFALPVVRRPSRTTATLGYGGYLASGPADASRLPRPLLPRGLRLDPTEGAGEVQTPVTGRAAKGLRIGDRVWFRHAKAGELSEHFGSLHLVEDDRVAHTVPTYRGEGKTFG